MKRLPLDPLPCKVETWSADGLHLGELLSQSSYQTIADAAFRQAIVELPHRRLTLRFRMRVIKEWVPDDSHSSASSDRNAP